MEHKACVVWSWCTDPTNSQLIVSEEERRASLLPLAHLAAWWLLLICPQASVSTSPIWTRIKGPNTNSCAEISHVSIYSYFVNQCTTHSAQIMNCYIWIRFVFSFSWTLALDCIHFAFRERWKEKYQGKLLWRRMMFGTDTVGENCLKSWKKKSPLFHKL